MKGQGGDGVDLGVVGGGALGLAEEVGGASRAAAGADGPGPETPLLIGGGAVSKGDDLPGDALHQVGEDSLRSVHLQHVGTDEDAHPAYLHFPISKSVSRHVEGDTSPNHTFSNCIALH